MDDIDTRPWACCALALIACLSGACESKSESTGSADDSTADATSSAPPGDSVVSLGVVGNRFEYDRTELEAEPGEQMEIRLTNTADDDSVKHNFVQLDTDRAHTAMKVAKAGWKVPEDDYVPEHEAVRAASPLAEPGETVDVSFTAPEQPGKYLYICTFPAHYPSMQGTLVVRE